MKELKVYKKVVAILTASTLSLMTAGCGAKKEEQKEELTTTLCKHVTVYFEDEPITFKQCEGYEIKARDGGYAAEIIYTVSKDGKILIDNGATSLYNVYNVNHDLADEIIENESVQKTK